MLLGGGGGGVVVVVLLLPPHAGRTPKRPRQTIGRPAECVFHITKRLGQVDTSGPTQLGRRDSLRQGVFRDHASGMKLQKVFLTAEWRMIAMLNYEVDPGLLLPFVPAGTELDRWNGKVFASLVGFRFPKTKVLGLCFPFHRNFDEVNLRFYVRRIEGGEVRRGVVFIKEVVPRWAIATLARTVYNERYVSLPMRHQIESRAGSGFSVEYGWRTRASWNRISLTTDGDPALPEEGSEKQFIAEHYWGYAAQPRGACLEYRVSHPSWRVWNSRDAQLEGDLTEIYGRDLAETVRHRPTSAFLAEGSEVAVHRGRKL